MLENISSDYAEAVHFASLEFGIPEPRIVAMIAQESSGRADAMGKAGEIGLMQITPGALTDFNNRFGRSYKPTDLTNPDHNIEVGTGYLAILKEQFDGSLDLATQAYNAGAGNVKKNPSASSAYLASVKSFEAQYNSLT